MTVAKTPENALRKTLARIAPGTELCTGLERILRGRTGGLLVLEGTVKTYRYVDEDEAATAAAAAGTPPAGTPPPAQGGG